MELVDTHCHLTSGELAGRADEIIAAAAHAGVTRMIAVACVPGEWDAALALQRRHPGRVWLAVGIHPHEAAKAHEGDFDRLTELWRQPGVVACGEMGLDHHYDFSPRPVQQAVFRRQLERARAVDLPVVIHCRNAHQEVVRLLLKNGCEGRRVVFHCFSGTTDEAAELWSHGWWTSFTGMITFNKAQAVQQACLAAPTGELMFETDAPYLSPEPLRKMRPNEPRNLIHTVRFAAGLRNTSFDALATASTANAIRFFNLAQPQ
ncbi:MAG: TatD family hydrolase [Planctomycetes bacterium]|nr:TatD family hydrolase [Planctomycetota bacterium]